MSVSVSERVCVHVCMCVQACCSVLHVFASVLLGTACVCVCRSSSERKRLRKKARQLARVHNRKVLETRAAVASQPST